MHSEMRVFGNLAKLAWQQLVVATAVIQACLVGALAVGLSAPAVEGLAQWRQASEASPRGIATDIAGGGADGGGGVKMVLCRDKCVSGCKVYRLPGLQHGYSEGLFVSDIG
jgi:hypothetical protein